MIGSDANMQSLYEEIARLEKRYLFEDQHRNCACKLKQNRLKKTFTRITSFDNEYLEEQYRIDRKASILEVPRFWDPMRRRSTISPMAYTRSLALARSVHVLKDIQERVTAIDNANNSISSLMFKSVQVHADIMALDATTTRLLRETRAIMRELEDVRYLDDLIALLNNDAGRPVIHKEWPLGDLENFDWDAPIEEGVAAGV